MIVFQSRIYRADLRANPDVLYVFGDNNERRGMGGQAGEMRGEPNAVGVRTKWRPGSRESDYFSDLTIGQQIWMIDNDLDRLNAWDRLDNVLNGIIVVPFDGIGTGLSELPERSPMTFEYLKSHGLGGVNA